MMLSHPLNKSLLVLISVFNWAQENQLQSNEIWIALVLVADALEKIKRPIHIPSLTMGKIDEDFKEINLDPKSIPTVNDSFGVSKIQSLPVELLTMVFGNVESQRDLALASRTCKRWNAIISPLIIKNPQVFTKAALRKFIQLGKAPQWRQQCRKDKIISLNFGSSFNGSFLGDENIQGIENLMAAHSCIYRIIVNDRNIYPDVHPIFQEISRTFPSLKYIKEVMFARNNRNTEKSEFSINRNGFTMSDFVLSRILRVIKRINANTEWQSISFPRIQHVVTFLLDIYQSETNSISKYVPKAIRNTRTAINNKIKAIMNLVSGALLLQVQYVTTSSQRLLDTYCMIYYEALDLCAILRVEFVKTLFEKAKSMESMYMYTREALCIYECVRFVFHEHVSPISESVTIQDIDYQKLGSEISRFPPSGMNSEICEFLENILERTEFPNPAWMDEDLSELIQWRKWINIVIQWFKSSKQMEPVKELLRGNMTKIDQLRSLQHRYGIVFMD
jgi:hypothetical protein